MKYRLDFITNSSSSSFIFGKPNENTIIIDDVYNIIKKLASDLIDIIDAIDKIASTTSEFKEYYLNLRGYKNILSRFDVYDRLRNDKNFQQTVRKNLKSTTSHYKMILKNLIQVSLIPHFYSVTQITMTFHGLDK